ncbi:hypothetical protein [Zunongwangia sp. HRR-M8]|uniref:hypothetical protein n=1 Tax=Zunongwangia sp. HRR-M8 TaxID=3015170 RepID=UPI0022DD6315|nr:hypothetical protein [Zunongwangia sp. HRR-M8]WBL22665.1 hypothetical protein PBT89_01600 [Zunongwangia sp. HRR-M8]
MKTFFKFLFCLLSISLISCDSDEPEREEFTVQDFSASNFPQVWKLVGVRASMFVNAEVGKVEDGSESYIFNEDLTFQKKSKIEGETIVAEGTFSIDDREFIILEYFEESSINTKCSSQSKKEFLYFSEGQLINSVGAACDGEYYYYERVE